WKLQQSGGSLRDALSNLSTKAEVRQTLDKLANPTREVPAPVAPVATSRAPRWWTAAGVALGVSVLVLGVLLGRTFHDVNEARDQHAKPLAELQQLSSQQDELAAQIRTVKDDVLAGRKQATQEIQRAQSAEVEGKRTATHARRAEELADGIVRRL